MNKKTIAFGLVFLFIILCIGINSYASTLSIGVSLEKDSYNVGDEIKVRVSWSQGMQAAGYILNYDSGKLQFVSANVSDVFYNAENSGKIEVAWASFDDIDYTYMDFTFKAIDSGDCSINITNPSGFADANLESPESYDVSSNGSKSISIKGEGGKIQIDQNDSEKPKADKTISEKEYPNTGLETGIIIAILVIIGVSIVTYKKYSNLSGI